jgi:serine protease
MITGLASIDTLNILYQVHTFEKVTDDSWSATKGFYLLRFPESRDVYGVHSSYSDDPHIHLVGLTGSPQPDVTPRDGYFPQQWGLSKIKCPDAWRYTNGSPDIIIQIIDGGTDYGHPDLVHKIWQNLGQWSEGEDADYDGHTIEWDPVQEKWILDPGDLDGIDMDLNGYCDDLVGFDFRDDKCEQGDGYGYDPQPTLPESQWDDWFAHGDGTAGTAAAVTDNWINSQEAQWVCDNDTSTVAGTTWFSKVMIARFGDPPWEEHGQAIRAIQYARNKGAKIISMSWSDSVDNATLHAALDSAYQEGLLLVASAGNQGSQARRYPAAYSSVIAVAGTDNNDVKTPNSNYGSWIDICAPWSNKVPSRAYAHWNLYCYDNSFAGTSASAPFVAGVAAMVWSCNLLATNQEVRDAVISTADNIYGIPGNYPYYGKLGSGRVNALRAVQEFRPDPPPPGDANTDFYINVGDVVYLVTYIYKAGPPPDPWCVGDATDDGLVDVGDIVYLVNYLYHQGPAPLDGCD